MALGIVLIALGAFGLLSLAGLLVAASSDGAIGIGTVVSLAPEGGAAVAAAVAAAGASLVFLGLGARRRAHTARAAVVHVDERVRQAEEEARARLLEMRLQQLTRQVDELERRRTGDEPTPALSAGWRPAVVSESGLVVLPDRD
jgi:hypothetical protein